MDLGWPLKALKSRRQAAVIERFQKSSEPSGCTPVVVFQQPTRYLTVDSSWYKPGAIVDLRSATMLDNDYGELFLKLFS